MTVVNLNIEKRAPYEDGRAFAATGPYEEIEGIATFAVDPEHAENRAIVDLELAPRDEEGRVRFWADFALLAPVDTAKGNRRLIVELPNRGRRRVVASMNRGAQDAAGDPPSPAGDGFLLNRGYAIASIGWQWDVHRSKTLMGLEPPMAVEHDQPATGQTVVEIRPNRPATTWLLADRVHKPYPAADLSQPDAVLLVRDFEDGEDTVVPRSRWRFAKETDAGLEPSAEHIYLEGGFEPGKYYQLVYRTRGAPVVGCGLLAVRDIASFLRFSSDDFNPAAGRFDYGYGYGVSQTGRMLRHLLWLGLNVDEEGRVVYDGLLPHVAGARRGQFNHRFAQPSNQSYPSFGHMFPFADEAMEDPVSGAYGGLLRKLRRKDAVPKIIYTNTSAEYWRGDAALMHVEPAGKHDLAPGSGESPLPSQEKAPAPSPLRTQESASDESPLPSQENPSDKSPLPSRERVRERGQDDSRIYHFAGTQHGPGSLPQKRLNANDGSEGRYGFNVVDYSPLLRAALVNLDRWVSEGEAPPPSCHPELADGTLTDWDDALEAFDRIPHLQTPDRSKLWVIRTVDLGPQHQEGVGLYPVQEGKAYPALVPAVDGDGNEVGGVRMPDVSIPVATHTGWNLRHPETGSPDQIIPMQGFSDFFPASKEERARRGDPRLSLEERYGSKEEYLKRVRAAAEGLAAQGYALSEDVDLMVDNAAARYDAGLVAARTGTAPAST